MSHSNAKSTSEAYEPRGVYLERLSVGVFGATGQIASLDALFAAMDLGPPHSSAINDQERRVLQLLYRDGMTLERAGKEIERSRERVRQIKCHALRKLRHPARRPILRGDTGDAS